MNLPVAENRIYCEKDYTALFGPRCFGCGSPIIGSAVEIEGSLYHQECLVCWQCGIHFGVGDEYISVDNMTLHPSCFCCFRCGAVIGEAEYGFEGEGTRNQPSSLADILLQANTAVRGASNPIKHPLRVPTILLDTCLVQELVYN